jgi:glucokinase
VAYENDDRIVLTLDAGGTNFVFSAIQSNEEIVAPFKLPSCGDDLDKSLQNIIFGFKAIKKKLPQNPVAMSFSFPGPADYPKGIIGDLINLPAYTDVPLGPMLQQIFGIPVFINNDGDLFAYGEALSGYLPYLNGLLSKSRNSKQYKNLAGLTLGTGFGGGLVTNGELYLGDNSAGLEVCNIRGRLAPDFSAEEGISIRAVKRIYAMAADVPLQDSPTPSKIYKIGMGKVAGNKLAALESYLQFGINLGDAIASILTLTDGIVVIGGGIAGAKDLFWQPMIQEIRNKFPTPNGQLARRLETNVFDLENDDDFNLFIKGESRVLNIPFSDKKIVYDPLQRVGVAMAKNDTSTAMAIGAYAFALHAIDNG